MRYMVHPELSIKERACWSVMVILSLACCIVGIVIAHERWMEKPLIVSFSPSSNPVWKMPFPAITICPQTRIDADRFNVTEVFLRLRRNHSLLSDQEWVRLRALSHVCSTVMRNNENYSTGTAADTVSENDVVPELMKISLPQDDLFRACMWSFNFRPCQSLWARKVTENGICYSFNTLSGEELYTDDQMFREEQFNTDLANNYMLKTTHASLIQSTGWTMEDGYTTNEDLLAYPRRTASGGFKGGILALLETDAKDREYICSGAQQGYKVTIHAPDEIPRLSEYNIRVPPMQAVSIIIKPRMMTTQKSLHRHPASIRQCYFSDERSLRFFRVYNEQNCEFECLANYTLKLCGCVTFAMPRTNTTRVCRAHEIHCYKDAATKLMELGGLMLEEGDGELCGCLPACTTIKYDVELSNDWLNLDQMLSSLANTGPDRESAEPMMLYVYFKDNKFLYTERVEYMTFNGGLASFGGILALLAGMSLISLAEMVYYLAVRPLCLWMGSRLVCRCTVKVAEVATHEVQLRPSDHRVHPVRPWIP
ncbi:pickpocket protein 28-like [Anopheles cruzii]|uniref:pickpocket protein 28-like n=1 Tax=Anopheles cruzii TaxID=68878 RepID=UPI0022EC365A|nr:pickpocket protein 28-like [Anopheles cruzii]